MVLLRYTVSVAILLCCFTSAEATQPAVVEVDSVDSTTFGVSALHSLTLGSSYAVCLASYHCIGGGTGAPCRPDGGEGFFIQQNGTSCTEDKGRVLKDAAGNCYYRQNLNGDLRQWGATIGSAYDCSPTTGAGAAGCSDALALLNAMQTSVSQAAFGIHHLTAGGVQIKLLHSFILDTYMDFGNDAQLVSGDSLIDTPGTVLLGDTANLGVTIDQSDYSSLHNLIVEPGWFPITYPTGPSGISELYAVRDAMFNNNMTGITCNAKACNDHDLTVAAFDTAFDMSGQSLSLNHIRADGNVCFWYHDNGSESKWSDLSCSGLATKGGDANEYFSITNVADNGSGVCRVTVSGSTSDLVADMLVWVSNLNSGAGNSNAVNANGRWKISLVPGHPDQVDLQTSSCIGTDLDGPSPTGTWVLGENRITGLSSTANIRQDQEVILPGGTTGLHVVAIWAAKNTVLLDGPIAASNSTGTVTFRGHTFTGGPYTCTAGGSSPCFILSAAERVAAGASAGGSAAGGVATAFMLGTSASGIQVSNAFVYGYALPVHVNDTQHVRFANFGTDATRSLKDDSTGFMLVDGSTKSIDFVNGGSGKDGAGLTINTGGNFPKGCVNLVNFNVGSFEVDDGCLAVFGTQGVSDYLLVGNDARRVQMLGDLKGLSGYYETPLAESVTDTNGLRLQAGPSWWGGQLDMGGPSPSSSSGTGLDAGSSDSAGRISVTVSGLTSVTVTFASTWPGKRPVCYATDETSNIAVRVSAIGNTSVTFSTSNSSSHFNVSDNISYLCVGFSK
jgi:hypothetical protein